MMIMTGVIWCALIRVAVLMRCVAGSGRLHFQMLRISDRRNQDRTSHKCGGEKPDS